MNFVVLLLLIVILECILLACGATPEASATVRAYKLELYDEGGKAYEDARAACESRDSWLVEIKDGEIDAALQSIASSHIWIGLSYGSAEWKWNDESQLRYEKWPTNQRPQVQSVHNNHCGQRLSSGYWRNYDCSKKFKYICQTDTTYPGSFNLTIVDPNPWVSFRDAKNACESDGSSRLVDIKTSALNSLISEMLSGRTYYYWTGGTEEEEGVFSWGDGTLISNANPAWLGSEPNNNFASENCLTIVHRSKWVDITCSSQCNYICQTDVSRGVCAEKNCLGKGICHITSRRYHCTCNPGLFGTKCEKDLVELSVDTQTIHVNRGETTEAQLTVVSYDGNVMLTRSKESATQIDHKNIDIATAGAPQSVLYDLGVQLESTVYKINARPSSGHSYSESATVTVTVTSLCESSPCQNSAFCTDIAVSPYFSCACKQAFNGTRCEGRKFIANAKCKFHVNNDIRATFTSANSTCVDLGGSLGMMKTPEVQDLVEGQVIAQYGATGKMGLWVGGYHSQGVWFWMDRSRIPMSGPNQKWKDSASDYMIISAWGSTRENMNWYSKKSKKVKGYVCEVAVVDPCGSVNCENGGTCVRTGCQGNCICTPGFHGNLCQNDRITITPTISNFIVIQGQTVVVRLKISSNHGHIEIEILKGAERIKMLKNVNVSANITIGPLHDQTEGDTYTFRATPESAPGSYYKHANVTIRVEGPPTVKVREAILTLPTGRDYTYIHCEATGVPKPSITWKQGGVYITTVRSAPVSQFTHNGHRLLTFLRKARTEVGHYTCYAENVVAGEIRVRNATLFVRGKLELVNMTEWRSEFSSEVSVLSCTYEGYPPPHIKWKLGTPVNSNIVQMNETGSIFQIQNVIEGEYVLNRTRSTLTVRLPEYLGQINVTCYASNQYENTTENHFQLNGDSVLWRNASYRIYEENRTWRNFSDAQAFCKCNNRSLVVIPDERTHTMISGVLENHQIHTNVFIGAQKFGSGNTAIWKWTDDHFINNDICHYRNPFEGVLMNGSYCAWGDGEPDDPGNDCAVLNGSNHWLWSDTKCNNKLGFICETQVAGIPRHFVVSVERCSANITITWTAGEDAIGVKHNIDILEISSASAIVRKNYEQIPVESKPIIHRVLYLNVDATYNVTISICPDCPKRYNITKTVSTYAIIPSFNLTVTMANVTRTGQACILTWSLTSKGIMGFKIVSNSVLVHAASQVYSNTKSIAEYNASQEVSQQVIATDPNRRYNFTIEVETCKGFGPPKSAYGECISKTAAPSMVPTPNMTQNPKDDGTMTIQIGIPDETNGPLSCVFVIVVYMPDPSRKNSSAKYRLDHLQDAMLKATSNKLNSNDAYLALAISRSSLGSELQKENFLIRNLGDETATKCMLSTNLARRRRKRSIPVNSIAANNRKLEGDASYSFFTVTATPSEDEIFFQASKMSFFFKPPSPNSAGMIAGIVISVAAVIFLVSAVFLWVKKKSKPSSEAVNMQVVQENQGDLYANLAMDNREPRSVTDIPLEQLHNTYNSLKAKDNAKFQEQFQKLKEEAMKLEYPTQVASNPALKKKNRYKNILPSDHSRVSLSGSGESTYINACLIHGFRSPRKFIATQGPLPATVNDFWRMIVEQNCSVIVMLTKCRENLKVKCEKYWPDLGSSKTFSEITVENSQEQNYGSYIVRSLQLSCGGKMKAVTHLHFLDWPDHGVPVTTTNILRYYEAVMKYRANSPLVVHCSAGAGRTGAFIAYDILSEEAESLSSTDVYNTILKMREQRVDMVQTCDQYIFVHKLLLEKYLFGKTDISTDEISGVLSSETTLRKEFKNLPLVGPINQTKFGDLPKNQNLNRKKDIIPYERNHVTILMRDFEAEVPYINASTIETYDPSTKLIAAQGPMTTSIWQFWRVIFDNNVNTIVMLTKCMEGKKEQSAKYWPDEEGGNLTLNDMTIYLQSLIETGQVIVRQFKVFREGDEKTVIQYQYVGWDSSKNLENPCDVLELVEKMHTSVRATTGGRALIHCSDGSGRTGAFCAIVNLLDRLKFENNVDVFRAVKDLRDCRPGMVQTMMQYRFCYEALSTYLSSFHLYSNFEVKEQQQTENIYENL